MPWPSHVLVISLILFSFSEAFDKNSIALRPLDLLKPKLVALDVEAKVKGIQGSLCRHNC